MKSNLNHQSNDPNRKGVEILSIGSELLLGNIVNSNAQWISEELSTLGLNHFRQSTIGDNSERIIKLVKEISSRSNLLIEKKCKERVLTLCNRFPLYEVKLEPSIK